MTIREAIELADEIKPNAFTERVKLWWINALEGRIAADVLLLSAPEIAQMQYSYPDDMETGLLIDPPHDDI